MSTGSCFKKLAAVLCLLGLTASGCQTTDSGSSAAGTQKEQPIQVLTIGTADSGGTMYPVGRAIAQVINENIPQMKINIGASNGSLSNVEGLRGGQIDLALVSADVAYCAYRGEDEFSGKPMKNLRAIGAVYFSCSNWIAKDSLNAVYVHDLLGKRVAVGPENSTTELSARIALQVVGSIRTIQAGELRPWFRQQSTGGRKAGCNARAGRRPHQGDAGFGEERSLPPAALHR